MVTATLRERRKDVLKASFPTPATLNEFVNRRENFFRNNGIVVTMLGSSTVYFCAEDYKKVPFVNFEVLSSDLKRIVGWDNVVWTTTEK